MKKRIFSLFAAVTLLATSLNVTALAAQGDTEDTLQTKYTYTNNGYTLEKVSHADVAPGEEDGLADYYEYYDQAGTVHTGVIEHTYTDGEWAEAETRLRAELTARHNDYSKDEIDALIAQIKDSLVGDGCQSYSYSAIGYGDWVYIGTMYGGIGIMRATALGALKAMGLTKDDPEYNNKLADTILNLLYGDHYYVEHVKPTEGILVKINVKTGESKVLMAGSVNGMETTLRGACEYNGKLYFVGAILQEGEGEGSGSLDNPLEGNTSGAGSAGMPSIYEVDPTTDKIRLVYQATTEEGYAEMVKENVFPTLRTIIEYKGSLIASVTDENGAHFIAYTPGNSDFNDDGSFKGIHVGEDDAAIRNTEFVEIADQVKDLYDYPAFTTMDSNYGGTVYQIIEFNGDLYAAINAGRAPITAKDIKTGEDTGCYRGWAIVKGSMNDPRGAVNDPENWTWTPIVGNTANDQWTGSDGARYTFNIDPERYAPGTCTLEVYNGYLYIGDYNDVTLATFGALYKKDFTHLAYNLKQSINLYRLDKDMNVELVVGDATDMFPDGSITGLGSGYYSHSNQYTAKATVWDPDKTDDNDGILFYSTLDEATILRPLAEVMNGDVLNMSEEEWAEKINYLKVIIQLLMENNIMPIDGDIDIADLTEEDYAPNSTASDSEDLTAKELVEQAIEAANAYDLSSGTQTASDFDSNDDDSGSSSGLITLTEEQTASLIDDIESGVIRPHTMPLEYASEALSLTYGMGTITDLLDASGQENIEKFSEIYGELVEYYQELMSGGDVVFPEPLQTILNQVLTENNVRQLKALLTCLNALTDSVIGCDTYAITTDADGSTESLKLVAVTLDGLGDSNNHTMRNFATTDDYLLFCTGNPVKGAQVWRLTDWPGKTDPTPDPEPDKYKVTLRNAGNGATGAGEYDEGATVKIYAGTKSGYTFSGWTTSDSVDISNAQSTKASFTMPSKAVTVTANWTYTGSSSGSSSGSSAYTITVKDSKNGTVTADRKTASAGTTVTLTVKPDQGWTLETLTATNSNGKEIDLNIVKLGETYTFKMPASNVTVTATFMEDNTILNYFVDVPTNSYYYDAVLWAVENGITKGTDDSHFDPNGICTRAQAVTFLWRAAGSPAPKSTAMPFTDVPAGSYYYNAVLWAVENGITKGTTDTTFSPNMNCSRAQIVTFLWRSENSPAAGTVNPFTDIKSGAYYADAVLWAVKEDVTKGTTDTTFSPSDNCTRAQIVTFIYRALAE